VNFILFGMYEHFCLADGVSEADTSSVFKNVA
jgi:hypothetical protein